MNPLGSPVKALVSAAAIALAGTAAQAETITFNFSGNNDTNVIGASSFTGYGSPLGFAQSWQQTQTTSDGDITVTVTPNAFTAGATGAVGSTVVGGSLFSGRTLMDNPRDPNALLTQTAGGLGIMNNGTAATDDAPNGVDGSSGGSFGFGWHDFLVIDSDRDVSFDYITLSSFGGDDSFRILFDTDGTSAVGGAGDFLTDALRQSAGTGTGSTRTFSPAGGVVFNQIGLAAVDQGANWQLLEIGLRLEDLEPPTSNPPTPAPVPLPAAAWMLLAAIGGLGAMRGFARQA